MRTPFRGVVRRVTGSFLRGTFYLILFPAFALRGAQTAPALQISQVSPGELAPGTTATLTITGSGFTKGCYVSFSSPAIHALSTRISSSSRLEAKVEVGNKAEPGAVALYVANSEGISAQIAFAIVSASSAASETATRAAAAATAEPAPSAAGAPVISSIEPQSAVAGTNLTIQVKGKNFVKGASVRLSNPGIEVLETDVSKATELSAKLRIASNAASGPGGLFVVNPDEGEAEGSFAVVPASGSSASPASKANAKAGRAATPAQTFDVINLGDAISVLQKSGKPQGVLTLSANHLEYDEQGKQVFSVPLGEIKEIAGNVFFGINTGTFHVILNSGATYNFIASSLSPQATQSIISSLQGALH